MSHKIKLYRGEFAVHPQKGGEYPCSTCGKKGRDYYVVPQRTLRARYWCVYCTPCHEEAVRRWTRETGGVWDEIEAIKVSRGGVMRMPHWQAEGEAE